MESADLPKGNSSRSRDRSPERDRFHVRFKDDREEGTSGVDEMFFGEDKGIYGTNPMKRGLQFSSRGNPDSLGQEKNDQIHGTIRSSEENEDKQDGQTDNLSNRRLPKRPDDFDGSVQFPSTEEKHVLASDSGTREGSQEDGDGKNSDSEQGSFKARRSQQALDDMEVSSDEFNEKLASLDEISRQYYHFFHLLDGVQSGCSVKTKKGVAGDFPAHDSFPMFKSGKYWIAIYWGVSLPMDTWAICFYTDHWSAHHGPKSALRTLPLSEISEVYLEPKTSAYFRIYRGKEVTQCTPTATTLVAALWADAIFAVLQLHNDHDIKTIKDHYQGYQSFVHAGRKDANADLAAGPPRTKRQSIFGKMKEIFSSSSGDNNVMRNSNDEGQATSPLSSPTTNNNYNSSGTEGGVLSSEGEQRKSSRSLRRWTTAVGGSFLNRSKSSNDASSTTSPGQFSSPADKPSNHATETSVDASSDNSQSKPSSMFFTSSPTRRPSSSSRRDSRTNLGNTDNESLSTGFLSQSVTNFHRPESASSLRSSSQRIRSSSASSDDDSSSSVVYPQQQQQTKANADNEEHNSMDKKYANLIDKSYMSNDVHPSSSLNSSLSSTVPQNQEQEDAKPLKSILISSSVVPTATSDDDQGQTRSNANKSAVPPLPEPKSIQDRLRVVAAYSSGEETTAAKKKKTLKVIGNQNADIKNGYFSDTRLVPHGIKPWNVQEAPSSIHQIGSSQNHHEKEEERRQQQNPHSALLTENISSETSVATKGESCTPSDIKETEKLASFPKYTPKSPASELGMFTALDLIYAKTLEVKKEQEAAAQQKSMHQLSPKPIGKTPRAKKSERTHGEFEDENRRIDQEKRRPNSPVRPVLKKSFSASSSSMSMRTAVNPPSSPAFHLKSPDIKKNRDKMLVEFLSGKFSTPFAVFSQNKVDQQRSAATKGIDEIDPQQASSSASSGLQKRQKGYLARTFSGKKSVGLQRESSPSKSLQKASLGSNAQGVSTIFKYGNDRAYSATTDEEHEMMDRYKRRGVARGKHVSSSIEQQPSPNNVDWHGNENASIDEPMQLSELNHSSGQQRISGINRDKTSPMPSVFVESVSESSHGNDQNRMLKSPTSPQSTTRPSRRQIVQPPPLPTDSTTTTRNENQNEDSGEVDSESASPVSPNHILFKVFNQGSSTKKNSTKSQSVVQSPGVASAQLRANLRQDDIKILPKTPSASDVHIPGVTSPLLEVDQSDLHGMLEQLQKMQMQYNERRPVHSRVALSIEDPLFVTSTDSGIPTTRNRVSMDADGANSSSGESNSGKESGGSSMPVDVKPNLRTTKRAISGSDSDEEDRRQRKQAGEKSQTMSSQPPGRSLAQSVSVGSVADKESNIPQGTYSDPATVGSPALVSNRLLDKRSSPRNRVGRHYSTGNMPSDAMDDHKQQLLTGSSPHHTSVTASTQKLPILIPRPVSSSSLPFSSTIQASLSGHSVTLNLLTKSELHQRLLSRPQLLPMRPGLQLSPMKQRPNASIPPSSPPSSPPVVQNSQDEKSYAPFLSTPPPVLTSAAGLTPQNARQAYLRQHQQARDSLEVTAMTMMAIAAELLDGECYLGIHHVSSLYAGIHSAVPDNRHNRNLSNGNSNLLEDVVEEYLYIPLGRIMTVDVDESRSGLFRFLVSAVSDDMTHIVPFPQVDACLYTRSFDFPVQESIFLPLFPKVLGLPMPPPANVGDCDNHYNHHHLYKSPSSSPKHSSTISPGIGNGRNNRTINLETAGGSAVGQKYNRNRIPQVKDPKQKVTSQIDPSTGLARSHLSMRQSNTQMDLVETNESCEYVPCTLKASSPEILPSFLHALLHLRKTVAL